MRIVGILWRHLNHPKSAVIRSSASSYKARSFGSGMKILFWTFALGIVVCLSAGIDLVAYAGNITYVYDPLGRLVGVIDGSGNAAAYQYNNVGNLLSISTTNSSRLSIFGLSPNNGPTNMQVTIYGDGFSTTPSQNTVTFNSQAATVTSSTQTSISTTVPAGVALGTGTVTVTAPAGSASAPFTVTSN
jgi:YD repeat-containing protein